MTDESDDAPDMAEINATPLIDVLLVLLIMVMISLPPSPDLVGLGLVGSPRPEAPPASIRLAIADDETIRWNGEALADIERLEVRLGDVSSSVEFHLEAGAEASYGRVAAVMAALQRHGIERVALDPRPD